MRITHAPSALFLAAALIGAAPTHGDAQQAAATGPRRFFVGVGAGIGRTAQPSSDVAHVSPALHLSVGYVFTPTLSLVLEGGANALGSLETVPNPNPVVGAQPIAIKLQTEWVLASLQVGSPGTFYVRPGVGIARHAFDTLTPQGDDLMVAGTSFEVGPAAGIAAGRQVSVIPGFPLNVEAVAVWTGGEDSTSPRWSTGLQIVHDFRF